MSILAAVFVTLFHSYCSVCLKWRRKIAKEKKQAFFKSNNCQKNFSIVSAKQQRCIILE